MTDRDFKLLVREYFNAKDVLKPSPTRKDACLVASAIVTEAATEKKIRAELARFTQQEIEELPFTTNDNEK